MPHRSTLTAQHSSIWLSLPQPLFQSLLSFCHNDLVRAEEGEEGEYWEIKWYQRLFAQFFDIGLHSLRRARDNPAG